MIDGTDGTKRDRTGHPQSGWAGQNGTGVFNTCPVSRPSVPCPGWVWVYRGQEYEFVGPQKHTKKDGTETTLLAWRTHCAKCNVPIFILTPTRFQSPSRRCQECKAPGERA